MPFFSFGMIFILVMCSAVTVTKHATTALKLLKENKNKFDLIISDVVMPGMDGFELLVELVGLEMDLPVISKPEESYMQSSTLHLFLRYFFFSFLSTLSIIDIIINVHR